MIFKNTTPLQAYLDKLAIEIKDNNTPLNNAMKETDDLKFSIVLTRWCGGFPN